MQTHSFSMTLLDASFISPGVKHFVFQVEKPLSYIPGQFITIHFHHEQRILKRSYSIANSPSPKPLIEFAASFIEGGPGSAYLFNLQKGAKIETTGPFGRLVLKEPDPKRYIFIATSTGITPYRAMLGELKKRLDTNPDLSLLFLEGVRRKEDTLYAEDFLELQKNYPDRVVFRVQLSRDKSLNPPYYPGYIQEILPELTLAPEEDRIFLCGNPAMIDHCFETLKAQGFNPQNIIREKYISAK